MKKASIILLLIAIGSILLVIDIERFQTRKEAKFQEDMEVNGKVVSIDIHKKILEGQEYEVYLTTGEGETERRINPKYFIQVGENGEPYYSFRCKRVKAEKIAIHIIINGNKNIHSTSLKHHKRFIFYDDNSLGIEENYVRLKYQENIENPHNY